MTDVQSVNSKLLLISVIGMGLSVYAFIVEMKMETVAEYAPMCDIHERISCSKAFTSEYGKGFGIFPPDSFLYVPNSVFGIAFYCIIISLSFTTTDLYSKALIFLAAMSNVASVYFAYILIFILQDLCVVCVSLYAVNAALLMTACKKYKVVMEQPDELAEEKTE